MQTPADIEILFCDEALLVVNKPAGLSTLPDGYHPTLPHVKSVLEQKFGRLWIVHRLDKETSGVLLLARSAAAHRTMNTQFEQHQVRKVYHALVYGAPAWQEHTVDLALKPNGDRQHRTVVDLNNGKPAVTHFRVLERFDQHCLLEAIPETGRTHQIRAHLSSESLSIIGDKLYTRRVKAQKRQEESRARPGLSYLEILAGSMALHARSLEVTHPTSGERLKISAPYPAPLVALLDFFHAHSHL
jgi:tRNA pseudouridine32 synthase / 23S rRNA pseudouridine746 synthase